MRHLTTSWSFLTLLLIVALLAAPAASAQDPAPGDRIGEVAWVDNQVAGTPPGGTSVALAANDAVVLEHLIEVGPRSGAGLSFEPDGSMTVNRDTRLTLDLYRREAGVTESAVSLLLGKVRLFLSNAFRGNFEIDTPTSTIGVKGTALVAEVTPSGDTVVWALEATGDDLTVTSKAGGSVVLTSGYMTTVARGAAPTPPVPFDPGAGVTAVVALPPLPAPPADDLFAGPLLPPEGENLPVDRGLDDVPIYVFQ